MKEIPPTRAMARAVCSRHMRECFFYLSFVTAGMYVLILIGLKLIFGQIDWYFFMHHRAVLLVLEFFIYMFPINVVVTRKVLRAEFKDFRVTTVEADVNIPDVDEIWERRAIE